MNKLLKLKRLPAMLGGLGLSTLSLTAAGSDWIVSPAVTVEQVYTDNALLTNDNEEVEQITLLRPSISVYREGARAKVDINYAPEYRHYQQETEDNEVVHFLRADGTVELAEQQFYLDGWATADLTNISSSGRTSLGGLTGRSNSTEVYTLGLSPYFKTHWGESSLFEARYTLDSVNYVESGLDDSVGQRADLVVGSGPAFRSQLWELSALFSRVDYSNLNDNNDVSRVRGEFVQQMTDQLALSMAAGYEDFNLAVSEDVDGALWSVGLIYTPTPRTRLTLGGGERAFGDDYYLDFSHRSQRTIWTAGYHRDYTSARDELMRPSLFQRQDAFGNLVRDAVLDNPPDINRESTPAVSPEYYELERVDLGFTFLTERTELSLGGNRIKRINEVPTESTRDFNLGLYLGRRVTPRTRAYMDLSWNDHEEVQLNFEQWVAALGGSYQLGSNTTTGIRLARLRRDAETRVDSYDENTFSIYLTATF